MIGLTLWLSVSMPKLQQSWVRSQHPPTLVGSGRRQMKQCWINYVQNPWKSRIEPLLWGGGENSVAESQASSISGHILLQIFCMAILTLGKHMYSSNYIFWCQYVSRENSILIPCWEAKFFPPPPPPSWGFYYCTPKLSYCHIWLVTILSIK